MTQSKAELRKAIGELKRAMTSQQMQSESNIALGFLSAMPEFWSATNIMLYSPLPGEVIVDGPIEKWQDMGKNIYLPRVNGNDIEVVKFSGVMRKGAFGINEPVGDSVEPSLLDLIVVPGIAFDADCNRLGRGRGYYDRLLAQCKAFTVGIAFNCQLVPEVPTNEHDVPLDAVVSPEATYYRNR